MRHYFHPRFARIQPCSASSARVCRMLRLKSSPLDVEAARFCGFVKLDCKNFKVPPGAVDLYILASAPPRPCLVYGQKSQLTRLSIARSTRRFERLSLGGTSSAKLKNEGWFAARSQSTLSVKLQICLCLRGLSTLCKGNNEKFGRALCAGRAGGSA